MINLMAMGCTPMRRSQWDFEMRDSTFAINATIIFYRRFFIKLYFNKLYSYVLSNSLKKPMKTIIKYLFQAKNFLIFASNWEFSQGDNEQFKI